MVLYFTVMWGGAGEEGAGMNHDWGAGRGGRVWFTGGRDLMDGHWRDTWADPDYLPPPVCKTHVEAWKRLHPWGSWGWSDGRWEVLRGYGCLWFPSLQWVLRKAMFHFLMGKLRHIGVLVGITARMVKAVLGELLR